METVTEMWQGVIDWLKASNEISEVGYSTWIKPIEPRTIEENYFVLYVQSNLQRNIIETNYSDKIKRGFLEVLGIPFEIKIITAEDVKATEVNPLMSLGDEEYTFEYTFDNFIVGSSNNFAYAAAQSVAKQPGESFNPLFIYGHSGLGKTHLLLAIKNYIGHTKPEANVLYIKCETMTNDLIEALQKGPNAMVAFRAKYRQVDVLLVDDIQFLANKDRMQEEFFHTFDTLHTARKQIILASDRPPREIATLDERLRNRFEMGLMADVKTPDLETRIAIINRKAAVLNVPVTREVTTLLAEQLKDNVRQLEGAVKHLLAQYMLTGEVATAVTAQMVIQDVRSDLLPTSVSVDSIITEVCRVMEVTREDLLSSKRTTSISSARQVAIYITRNLTNMSTDAIGTAFGDRDHSTILYTLNKVEDKMQKDPLFRSRINDLMKNIVN